MAVNLLARQFCVVQRLVIDVPSVAVHDRVRPIGGSRNDLRGFLCDLALSVGGGEVAVEVGTTSASADVNIVAGSSHGTFPPSPVTLYCLGDGWKAFCSDQRPCPSDVPTSTNPAGPFLAACLAAGATFRALCGASSALDQALTLWGFEVGEWDVIGRGPSSGIRLPAMYIIGLGAVGAALIETLAATEGLSGETVLIDPQEYSDTDLNRTVTGVYRDVGKLKVDLAAAQLGDARLQAFPNPYRWPNYLVEQGRRVPPALAQEERTGRYRWILSCVDRNRDRRAIAGYGPRHVLGGSTDGLVSQVVYYSHVGDCECLACNHPLSDIPTTEELREQLLSLPQAGRSEWYRRHDASPDTVRAIEEYLSAPICGHIGEYEMQRLGVAGAPDWAAGFVSVAAGVMLAAAVQQSTVQGVASSFGLGAEVRYTFLTNRMMRSRARRRVDCPVCGEADTQARFARRWEGYGL